MITQVLEHPDMMGTVITGIPGEEIERRRHELGWTQAGLAERAKVSTRTVQTAERGDVSDRSYLRIVRALEDGEAQARGDSEADLVTATYVVETSRGSVRVVVTATKDAVRRINPAALVADALDDE